MKKTVLRYSLLAMIPLFLFLILPFIYASGQDLKDMDMSQSELIGWAGIVLSQALVILAIKQYRDKEKQGHLGYWQGVKLGTLIALISGLLFGIASFVLYEYVDPDFTAAYYQQYEDNIRNSGAEPAVIEAQLAQLDATPDWLMTSWMGGILMFGNVFPTGFIISLIASGFLYRKPAS